VPYREIAERLGISLRSVEREMGYAFDHCAERLKATWEKGRVDAARNVLKTKATRSDDPSGNEDD
jgi:RNA polymerase sigma-70 factor, ECF subfamily